MKPRRCIQPEAERPAETPFPKGILKKKKPRRDAPSEETAEQPDPTEQLMKSPVHQ